MKLSFPWALCVALATVTTQVSCDAGQCACSPLLRLPQETRCRLPRRDEGFAGEPWWKTPHECIREHCVFLNPGLRGELSMLTTEKHARTVQEMIARNRLEEGENDLGSPADFHEMQILGKGLGLVASRAIRRGERIMTQTPSVIVQLLLHNMMPDADRDRLYDEAIGVLPEARRTAFLRQVGDSVFEILDNNCFRMGLDKDPVEGAHLGCFIESARFNHDCRPNAQYHVRNLALTVIAVRDIAPGEEITISYIEASMPRAERQERLASWGFRCTCPRCTLPDAEAADSDARIHQIAHLREALDDPDSTEVDVDSGDRLVSLYREEGLDLYLGGAHTRAALNYALFGLHDRAREHAELAIKALETQYGPHAGDIESMRTLARDPRIHWTWGKRRFGWKGKGAGGGRWRG